jgi:alpha-aminoadipate/glutamate carrier protein LysW
MDCPECDAEIKIPDDASVGEIDFEISKKEGSNVQLKAAESVGEDWGE